MIGSRGITHRFIALFLVSAPLLCCGCGRKLETSYGQSKGYKASRSVNGFTALREAYAKSGFKHRDLNRLTSRVRKTNVVVWTPTYPSGIHVKTTRWFESWLAMGQKTLVYVLPDSGSESAYYREASGVAIPTQRLEYRRKYAESLNREHGWEMNRSYYPSNGWFDAKPRLQTSPLIVDEDATGTWQSRPSEGDDVTDNDVRCEWVLEPYQKDQANKNQPMFWQPVGPTMPIPMNANGATTPSTTEVAFTSLLKTDNGDTVVAKVTSRRWKDSQILIVASGSLLTNFGLTSPANQRLAKQLINASFEPMIVGGLVDEELRLLADGSEPQASFAYLPGQFPISERVKGIPRATGAELLTVYPISLVTMHMAVIGFVICLMLLPTFGRPRTITRRALTHFGDHLEAVGTLMRRRGGESFARRRISEYMKRVRGETSGNWVLPDDKPKSTPIKAAVATGPVAKNSDSKDNSDEATQSSEAPS